MWLIDIFFLLIHPLPSPLHLCTPCTLHLHTPFFSYKLFYTLICRKEKSCESIYLRKIAGPSQARASLFIYLAIGASVRFICCSSSLIGAFFLFVVSLSLSLWGGIEKEGLGFGFFGYQGQETAIVVGSFLGSEGRTWGHTYILYIFHSDSFVTKEKRIHLLLFFTHHH